MRSQLIAYTNNEKLTHTSLWGPGLLKPTEDLAGGGFDATIRARDPGNAGLLT